ncbi:hypothetical protein [Catenuloplanes atrovinosus]|uniref:Fluoride ion exporter CrcB/FEX n=1 Tax=Catenuloplanes atrovinosus TaxID=137266 RepID=A0AAE3YXT4_9ACTN|nr:hypothetical protein [Catenuloplanes atrovinosus]MDR7280555.1 fluoride ion exporter CrcB/FEX [Catenuloplanes atrovinosus]
MTPDRVTRRFARLLRAYPPGPRRAELLDTLLEQAATEGRTRPTLRQITNITLHGVRTRALHHPRSAPFLLLATLVALTTAFLAASLASHLAWRAATPPLPAAAPLHALVMPGAPIQDTWTTHTPVDTSGPDGPEFGALTITAAHTASSHDPTTYLTAVRSRLTAAGWHVAATRTPSATGAPHTHHLTATSDSLHLHIDHTRDPLTGDGSITLRATPTEPRHITAITLTAALGLLLGWLLTTWSAHTTRHHPTATTLAALTSTAAALLLLPATYFGTQTYLQHLATPHSHTPAPLWRHLHLTDLLGGFSTLALLPATIAVTTVIATHLLTTRFPHPLTTTR